MTWATVTEVVAIIGVLLITINWLDMVGAIAAALAMLTGRLACNLYLVPPRLKVLQTQNSTICKYN